MRHHIIGWFFILMAFAAIPINATEIRGEVAGMVQGSSNFVDGYSFAWSPQNFAGFFYDMKKDLGNEYMKAAITGETVQTGGKLSGDSPFGLAYTTSVQPKAYEQALWGAFSVIGFLGNQYFAGYLQGNSKEDGSNIFYAESTDPNSLASEQLERILLNSKQELTVIAGTPLILGEGYVLTIKLIDGNGTYLELAKNDSIIDSKVLTPSKDDTTELEKTYFYRNPHVGSQDNLVTIGVHFKNALVIQNKSLATIDGIWQISDTPIDVRANTQYGKMTIIAVDATNGVIVMANWDEPIVLGKNEDIEIMPGFGIKVANNDTLRFYIYKEEPCKCE